METLLRVNSADCAIPATQVTPPQTKTYKCRRCGGTGMVTLHHPVYGNKCFGCSGIGTKTKTLHYCVEHRDAVNEKGQACKAAFLSDKTCWI